MEVQAAAGEIARLEALLGADPAAPGFPALAEANRRAGRLEEAERVAREGLRRRPELIAGRVALALALLDLGRAGEARVELERALEEVPDHPLALQGFARAGGAPLEALGDDEIEGAFAEAESAVDEMRDANHVAAEALRAADLDEPEGVFPSDPESPFATRTVAGLLESQGHRAEAAALREELSRRSPREASLGASLGEPERERVIATLERWLENLRRTRR
jgi:tetratricopeptide (TPR) repeat protein